MTAPRAGGGAGPGEFVDLHMHSTASDGALSPAAVVAAAAGKQLAAIALTDHDTVAGIAEALEAARGSSMRVVAGVELSAVEGALETHLLGLHLSRTDAIEDRLARFRGQRRDRALRIVERLNELGVDVRLDTVLAYAAGGAVGRPHIARALVQGGWVHDGREAFDRFLGNGRPAFVAKPTLSIADAIAVIHEAGGIAVLAHPGSGGTRERLAALCADGLDGVEVVHPSHSPDDVWRLEALCRELALVPSGGSDWHGAPGGARTLGSMRIRREWLDQQDELVRTRHGSAA